MVVRIGDRKPLTSKLMGRKGEGRLNIGAEREARPSLWSLERSAGADEVARLKWVPESSERCAEEGWVSLWERGGRVQERQDEKIQELFCERGQNGNLG